MHDHIFALTQPSASRPISEFPQEAMSSLLLAFIHFKNNKVMWACPLKCDHEQEALIKLKL